VLQQIASPTEIYNRPRNMFVAAFIGSPTMNLYWAELAGGGEGGAQARFGSNAVTLPPSVLAERPRLDRYRGRKLVLGIRPEDIADARIVATPPNGEDVTAKVELVEALGSDVIVHMGLDAQPAHVVSSDSLQEIQASDEGSRCVARFTAKSQVGLGETIAVRFDTERLHFFDGTTGEAIFG